MFDDFSTYYNMAYKTKKIGLAFRFIYLFTYLFIYLLIYLFIYLFIVNKIN